MDGATQHKLLEATDSAGDKIAIGNGANLSTTVISKSNIATTPLPGQISVVVGQSVPLQPVAGSAPLNVM